MHGSKRNEIVLFRANADLSSPITYFIPEVFQTATLFCQVITLSVKLSCRTEADYLAAGEIPPLDSECRKRICLDDESTVVPLKVPPQILIN